MAEPAGIRAAGAVLWRPGRLGVEVALVHRPRYGDWSLPKGKPLPGEHVLITAVREVAEETGVRVRLGRRLPSARYLSDGVPKRVDYWVARPAALPAELTATAEVDEVAWLPLPAARERLTHPHDVTLLDGFSAGPAATVPLILIRHAVAAGKEDWRGSGHPDDLARPLTPRGLAQARALVGLLDCFAPTRVISSGAERCLATVRPYAAARGLTVAAEPAFTVAGGGPDVTRDGGGVARQRVAQVIADGEPAVVCAHRENLPSLLAWACADLGARVPAGPPLDKGAFWVLQIGAGRLVSAERHRVGGGARAPA